MTKTYQVDMTRRELACALFAVRDRAKLCHASVNRFKDDTHGFADPATTAGQLHAKLEARIQEILEEEK